MRYGVLSACLFLAVPFNGLNCLLAHAADAFRPDVAAVEPDAEIRVDVSRPQLLAVEWPLGDAGRGVATFRLAAGQPLIESFAVRAAAAAQPRVIARDLTPFTAVTVGTRNLETRGGWTIFFDKVHERPYQRYPATLTIESVRVAARGLRGSVTFDRLAAGPFSGSLVFSFFAGSPLILAEAVVSTQEESRAIVYDAGLIAAPGAIERFAWADYDNTEKSQDASAGAAAAPRGVRYRTVAAEMAGGGAMAVFPPPHRFFYPLDFADNLGFNWLGRNYSAAPAGDGLGIRQPPEGDGRFTPWVNAPPGTAQRLGTYYLVSPGGAAAALAAVRRYTRSDHYPPLPGYKTFTSHYHIEHTLDLLKRQASADGSPPAASIPAELESPGFVRAFRTNGVDIVHLAEFHNGKTPRLAAPERLHQLRTLHSECRRLSNDTFLLLPGEEPNVQLGGHWISLFPRPVLWVLHRPAETPFVETSSGGETVYHVASPEDVLELMRREQGLMWTAHARIKSSVGYPDAYRDSPFFRSPQFLGAAWKAMPADYSRDTLGWRVLDLLDDMNNWGPPKQVIGEVDVFQVDLGSELYGHANVNYVQLERLPRFDEGWAALLAALRGGRFFTTTGEILITDFGVTRTAGKTPTVQAHLAWTFPLAHAEIVGGDGTKVHRHRVDLSRTREFSELDLRESLPAEFDGCRWLRLEAWDVATNGAFTQPAWPDGRELGE